jgi:hypothetical protein
VLLAGAYALFAWFRAQERWAHVAAWLGVLAGGVAASAYSTGRGSAAFKVALLAAVYVLLERALNSQTLQRRRPGVRRAWSLYRRALLVAGWTVSGGAIGLALIRNLVLLEGGRIQTIWAIAGLLTITALYAASAWLFRRRIFLWLAGLLLIAPWTLLALWGWFVWPAPALPRFALAWTVLACLQLGVGLVLTHRSANLQSPTANLQPPDYGFPLRAIVHILLPFALFWAVADSATSSITWGLGVACYAAATVADHRRGLTGWRAARFLYPVVAAAPVWSLYLLHRAAPNAAYAWYGLTLLAFALPLLALGRRLRRVDPADGLPLYLATYGVAIVGTLLVGHQQPLLAAALTFDALLCVLSARIFRQPGWGYPAAALAAGAMLVALAQSAVPPDRRGWFLIGLGAVYLALACVVHRARQHTYATPPLAMAFLVVALGLPPSSLDDTGAFWGYLAAAGVYAAAATWLRQPLLLAATAALLAVPYGVAGVWLGVRPAAYGLAIFPGVVVALALAHLLDWRSSRPAPVSLSGPPWSWRWGSLLDWWAAPWYAWGYLGALVAAVLSWADPPRLAIALALAAATFLHATWRFRVRGYLLLAGALAQGAVLAVIDATGWLVDPAWAALAFLPVTVLTGALALAIEQRRQEGSPLRSTPLPGWSRPLYLLLIIDLLGGQAAALFQREPGTMVTGVHALLLAVLATVWAQRWLPFAPAGLGIVALLQGMAWVGVELTGYAVSLALLALGYGLVSYGLQVAWSRDRRAQIWLQPLEWTGLGLSALALLWALAGSLDVVGPLVRAASGRAVTAASYVPQARVLMWVLAISGLLYLATALVRRLWLLSYGAMALLLGAWALWWRFFLDMPNFQWYAVPAAVYLLGVGWLEWRQGRKAVACWIDRAGLVIGLGSAWVQSVPGVMETGWPYALIMGAEALLLVWWGSARRQKQFLYIGVVGVVLAAVTQSIEPLMSANRWIVFGIVGTLLVGVAIVVERKLEQIRELSAELRLRLEGWE